MENIKKTRVLIADDSETIRTILKRIFDEDPSIEVVGTADNGADVVKLNSQLHPDIITMDIRMPVMDGLTAIEHIMVENPCPILVLTSNSMQIEDLAFKALSKGALDIMDKPELNRLEESGKSLIKTLKMLSEIKVIRRIHSSVYSALEKRSNKNERKLPPITDNRRFSMIAMASSTGGPITLNKILSSLPPNFLPIVIVQHIQEGFTEGLVRWLATASKNTVKMAEEGESLKSGTVYIAPDGVHIGFHDNGSIRYIHSPAIHGIKPSADVLFHSTGEIFKDTAIGVILTGMGADGAEGIKIMKTAGGCTIAQNEETCVVFGMPKEAIARNAIDYVLPLDKISEQLIHLSERREKTDGPVPN